MFNGYFNIKGTDVILSERGLEPGGKVQKYIDDTVIDKMVPYTPRLNGSLSQDAPRGGSKIGTGIIEYASPYARYQYYGKLMVSSITGSAWSRGEKKVLTDVDLKYNGAPIRGAYWFERMKADHKDKILEGARKIAGAE